VTPAGLSLKASQNADVLWLRNTGDGLLPAQVRVYRRTRTTSCDPQLTLFCAACLFPKRELPRNLR
jgi:hypothetical protein